MARLGPFEPVPRVAVAVSGGADSVALALLADHWTRAQGGGIVALTVDHALRPESAAEARQVAAWMAARSIPHHILTRQGPRPAADLQAAARNARYALLEEWCRIHGVGALLLAHHLDDQAETLLLRLGRGSGVDGLAAMAPRVEHQGVTLLRPLLNMPSAALKEVLARHGQDWIDDPSNDDPAYARVRLRRLAPQLAAEGMTPQRLADTARRLGRVRQALETLVSQRMTEVATLHPAGYAIVRREGFVDAPEEIGLRLLLRLLQAVGGAPYPPRSERSERLHRLLCGPGPVRATLAGCRIVSHGGDVLICREPARLADPVELSPGRDLLWDGRMRVRVPEAFPVGLRLAGLGGQGWRLLKGVAPVPAAARPTLPTLWDADGVFAVPHLGYNRGGSGLGNDWIVWTSVASHCLVPAWTGII
jgi:tRNA(Ile)-lysidine synthase